MKRPRSVFIGVICGIVCAASVFAYMQNVKGEVDTARAEALARYGGDQIEVCIASRDIAAGESLDSSNTVTKLWVADLLPPGAVRSVHDAAGRRLGSPVYAGEVISEERFSHSERTLDVPAGTSVLSVPVKDVQAVGGAVRPGLLVDVYATGAGGTDLLASSVPIVSSNTIEEEGAASGAISWVTLAVRPESVLEIITASQKTELYLVVPETAEERGEQ